MRCIVSDLDRTLTGQDLRIDESVLDRIRALRGRGFSVVIATGRRFDEVDALRLAREVDGIVAENGALVCLPERGLIEIAYPRFAARARGALGELAERFTWGRAIGSGPRDLALVAGERLARSAVAHSFAFNVGEVMLLPPGIDKAVGAARCLDRLGLRAEDAWAIGDGENDAALLEWAHLGAAPANASREAVAAADVLLLASYGRAFLELTEPLLQSSAARAG